MSLLNNAFKFIVYTQGSDMTISKSSGETANIKIASANFSRNLAGPENMVIEGREFIVVKEDLDNASFGIPERGDSIQEDADTYHSITEVKRQYVIGKVVGYRIRTK